MTDEEQLRREVVQWARSINHEWSRLRSCGASDLATAALTAIAPALEQKDADIAHATAMQHAAKQQADRLWGALSTIARGRRVDWDSVNFSYEPLDEDEARLIARTALAQGEKG